MLYVRDIIELPLLKTSRVKSGKDVLDQKLIEWVSVIESPVENFVRENEFVLSTGIGCHEDFDILLEFVEDVYNSGASALAFATGRYIFEIPKEIIQFAEERNFILIEIPWEIRFADIVQEVLRELNHIQQRDLNRSKDVQQKLIQMILDGKNLGHITSFVENEIRLPILILDKKGIPVAGSAKQSKVFSLRNRLMKLPNNEEASHHPMHSKMKTISDEEHSLSHLFIQTNGVHEGEICVLSDRNYQLNQQEIQLIEHTKMASALWFSRNSVVTKAEMRLQNDFLLRLIKGESLSDEYKKTTAEQFHLNLNIPYDCIIGHPENLQSIMEKDHKRQSITFNWLENMIIYIKEEMLFAAEAVKHQQLFAYEGDKIIVFLEVKKDSSDSVNHFLDLVERRLNHLFPGVTFSWGIGKHKEESTDFSHSFKKAQMALDMGRTQIGIGKRVNFDETRINRLMLNLALNDEVQEIMAATISPLIEYDEKRDMDLINTFIGYNRNSGNVSQTARDLNLHRQSLLYRLRKIESLTGLSLVNPDDLFLLDFSIRVWSTGVIKRGQINTEHSNSNVL